MRFERLLLDLAALLDRFVAIMFVSFDLFSLGPEVVAVTNHSITGVQFQSQRVSGTFCAGNLAQNRRLSLFCGDGAAQKWLNLR
jgi:hypothetical protein